MCKLHSVNNANCVYQPSSRVGKKKPFMATVDSVQNNWPTIPGPKLMAAEFQSTYKIFFEEHVHQLDPCVFVLQFFLTGLWIGVVNGTWLSTILNFMKVTTSFFFFWSCYLPDGFEWWKQWPLFISWQTLINVLTLHFQTQEPDPSNCFWNGNYWMPLNWWQKLQF